MEKEKVTLQMNILADKDLPDGIDELAKDLDLKRNQLLVNYIKLSHEDAVALKKTGFLALILAGRKAIDKVKADVAKGDIASPLDMNF
jgi:hypothetical protein